MKKIKSTFKIDKKSGNAQPKEDFTIMKYVVVGTSHAGYAVIETLLISDSEAEIEVFESAEAPSFLSCGIQSYLEDVAPSLQSLHYADAESLKEQGVNLHLQTTVTDLDTQNKTVTIKKMATLQKSLTINYS